MTKKGSKKRLSQFTQAEVRSLFSRARSVFRSPSLEIRQASRPDSFARILIVIPRVVGNAVQRNLLRRRIKNIFHQHHLTKSPYDWLVLARKGAAQLSFEQLQEIFNHIIS